jgi:hypothetical protein
MTQSRSPRVIDAANRKLGRSKRTQCGRPTKSKIVLYDRTRQQTATAEEHFRAAIDLWKAGDAGNPITGPDAEARRAAAAYAAAGAAFYLAEKDYEDLLRVKFPQNLDFSDPARVHNPARRASVAKKLADSQKRFRSYLDEKSRLLEKTRLRYLEVFKLRQAQWTIAAAARVGQLHQDFAGQLYTAEIPKDLPETDAWGKPPARPLLRAARGPGRQGGDEGARRLPRLPGRGHAAVVVQQLVARVRARAEPAAPRRVPRRVGGEARGRLRPDEHRSRLARADRMSHLPGTRARQRRSAASPASAHAR